MAVALWLLGALLALLALTLVLPWHVRVRLASATRPHARVSVRLWGGLAPAIPITGAPGRERRRGTAKAEKMPGRAPHFRRMTGIGRLLSDILDGIHLRDVAIDGRVGLDDPADTGTLYGALVPLAHIARGIGGRIDIAPDFSGPALDLTGRAVVILHPARIGGAMVRFVWANRTELLR